jgi:hypothetical protein
MLKVTVTSLPKESVPSAVANTYAAEVEVHTNDQEKSVSNLENETQSGTYYFLSGLAPDEKLAMLDVILKERNHTLTSGEEKPLSTEDETGRLALIRPSEQISIFNPSIDFAVMLAQTLRAASETQIKVISLSDYSQEFIETTLRELSTRLFSVIAECLRTYGFQGFFNKSLIFCLSSGTTLGDSNSLGNICFLYWSYIL